MTKVVSMLNMKGGVGKTTLTYNLAWYLGEMKNYRVLVVDLDPQSNLTQLLLGEGGFEQYLDRDSLSIVDIFEKRLQRDLYPETIQLVQQWTHGGCVHLIPSRLELSITLKNSTSKERRLARFLGEIKNDYDIILLDCPPTESILTIAAYLASDYVLIPVKLERLATIGLPLMARSIKDFNEEYQNEKEIKVAGILLNNVDNSHPLENKLSQRDISNFSKAYGWHVFEHEVNHSRSFLSGSRQGTPIFHTPRAHGHIAEQFYNVGNEFLKTVGLE